MHAPSAVVALDPLEDRGPRAPAAPMDEFGLEGGEKLTTKKVQINQGFLVKSEQHKVALSIRLILHAL